MNSQIEFMVIPVLLMLGAFVSGGLPNIDSVIAQGNSLGQNGWK